MRVLFCGSRDWTHTKSVIDQLEKLDPKRDTIVHGAGRGLDAMAGYWAKRLGFQVEAHPAEWDRYGKAAGPIRNLAMVESGIDLVVAFPKGESRGTRHTMALAAKKNIEVKNAGE